MEQDISYIRASLPDIIRARLNKVNEVAKPALNRTTNFLPGFTEHTLEHSLGVEQIYDIIFSNDFSSLSNDEKFLLIAATILHDIGMVGQIDQATEGYEDRLRDGHHVLSKQSIIENRAQFGFSQIEAELIGRIAEAHRKVTFESLEKNLPFGIGKTVRPRFLGALLRLADELHVTDDRAPELVKRLIKPNLFSSMHHERHQVIMGVDRSRDEHGVINISAIVKDWEMEDALNTMVNEIQSKLESVKEILIENEVFIDSIKPQYIVSELITKEALLYLSNNHRSHVEQVIAGMIHRDPILVNESLNSLYNSSYLNFEENIISISENEHIFKLVFNQFRNTRYELDFIRSSYVRANIGKIFDDIALKIYATRYTHGDKEDRLLLISNSPTVLDNLLNNQDVHTKFGHMNRSSVLDLLILSGYMQDVTKNPLIASYDDESVITLQAIANSLHKELGPFLSVLQNIESAIEQKKMIVESPEENSIEHHGRSGEETREEEKKITVMTTIDKDSLPHTDFLTIMTAAGIAHEKVTFHGNIKIKDVSNGLPDLTGELLSLEIIPQTPVIPQFYGSLMGDLREDLVFKTLYFEVNDNEGIGVAPYFVSFNYYAKNKFDFTIKANRLADTNEYLKLQKIFLKIRDFDYRRFYVSKVGDILIRSSCPKINQGIDKEEINLIEKINEMEISSPKKIGVPYTITAQLTREINKAYESWVTLNHQEKQKQITQLQNIHGVRKCSFYTIKLKNEDGSIVSMKFFEEFGWINYNTLGFKSTNQRNRDKLNKIISQQGSMKIVMKHRLYSPSEIFDVLMHKQENKMVIQSIFDTLKDPILEPTSYKTEISIDFKAPDINGIWDNIQQVEISIETIKTTLLELEDLLMKEEYIKSIPLLEEYKDSHLESLAFAYCLNKSYDEAINCANEAIEKDLGSVAHMTKGLAYIGKGDYENAYNSYLLGIHSCVYDWYPIARDNLENLIQANDLRKDDILLIIIDILSVYSSPLAGNDKCYCKSGKKFKKCHGREN